MAAVPGTEHQNEQKEDNESIKQTGQRKHFILVESQQKKKKLCCCCTIVSQSPEDEEELMLPVFILDANSSVQTAGYNVK